MNSTLRVKDKSDSKRFLKVATFRKDIRKTEPHKHNSYIELVFLSKGGGTHTIDYSCYAIQPPVIFFIRREQVHQWELTTEPDGFVMILKREFLDQSLDGELKALLTALSGHACLQITNGATIEQIFRLIVTENNFQVQEGLLKALLSKVMEVALPVNNKTHKNISLFQSLCELLSQHNNLKNDVAYYAKMLHTTPQNLNAVCRKAANISASELLSQYVISEAKRLLLYTGDTVTGISASLGFSDASHFVKYFKRYTLQTPLSYRNQ